MYTFAITFYHLSIGTGYLRHLHEHSMPDSHLLAFLDLEPGVQTISLGSIPCISSLFLLLSVHTYLHADSESMHLHRGTVSSCLEDHVILKQHQARL